MNKTRFMILFMALILATLALSSCSIGEVIQISE